MFSLNGSLKYSFNFNITQNNLKQFWNLLFESETYYIFSLKMPENKRLSFHAISRHVSAQQAFSLANEVLCLPVRRYLLERRLCCPKCTGVSAIMNYCVNVYLNFYIQCLNYSSMQLHRIQSRCISGSSLDLYF